jgi:hypothetical protein
VNKGRAPHPCGSASRWAHECRVSWDWGTRGPVPRPVVFALREPNAYSPSQHARPRDARPRRLDSTESVRSGAANAVASACTSERQSGTERPRSEPPRKGIAGQFRGCPQEIHRNHCPLCMPAQTLRWRGCETARKGEQASSDGSRAKVRNGTPGRSRSEKRHYRRRLSERSPRRSPRQSHRNLRSSGLNPLSHHGFP